MTHKLKETQSILMSRDGLKDLKKQVKTLEHDLNRASDELKAMDKTDRRDNQLARIDKLTQIESIKADLAEKRDYLSRAKLLPTRRRLKVGIGSLIELVDTLTGRTLRFRVVESVEANPSDGRISIDSPLGKSLLGKQVREEVHWTAGLRNHCMVLAKIF